MTTLPGFRPRILRGYSLFLCALFALGCRAVANPPPVSTITAPATIAGIAYDKSAPLDADVQPLSGGATPSFKVRFRGANNEMVPGVLVLPATAGNGKTPAPAMPVPAVLLLHGLGRTKGDFFLGALALAQKGYATLAIDIAGHGERPLIHNKPVAELSLPETRQMVAQTVVDLRRAVDYLSSRPDIDANRIGFVGLSLGGIIGSVFAGDEPGLKTAVLWSSGGDWGTLITTSTHPMVKRFQEKDNISATEAAKIMEEVEPTRWIGRFAPRPLLLLHGSDDTVVPKSSNDALFQAAGEIKERVILPGGHVPDVQQLLSRTIAWLDKNLK